MNALAAPLRYCQHAICRADATEELAWMAQVLKRKDLHQLAIEAQSSTVRCRLMPRKGPVHAPFPPRLERP